MRYQFSSNAPLTAEEIERSVKAQAAGLHADVTPADLFSANSSGVLAALVRKQHPVRYQQLKLEFKYQTNQLKRPDYDE